MKQILAFVMMLMVAFAGVPHAFADEGSDDAQEEAIVTANTQTSVDDETEDEVEDMDNMYGAQMRLLQLQEQIDKRIITANNVIERIEGNNTTNTTAAVVDKLEAIVVQLEELSTEAEAAADAVTNQTQQDAVETFLNIKADAKALVEEFRSIAKDYVRENEKQRIKDDSEKEAKERLKHLEEKIHEKREAFNELRVEGLMAVIGMLDAETVAKIRAGTITAAEVRTELKARFASLSEDQRDAIEEKLRESATKRRITRADTVVKFKETRGENAAVRLEERAEILKERGFGEASEHLQIAADRIAAHANLSAEEKAQLRVKYEERIKEHKGESETRIKLREKVNGVEKRIEVRQKIKDGVLETRTKVREKSGSSDDGSDDSDNSDEDEVEDESNDDSSDDNSSDDDSEDGQ